MTSRNDILLRHLTDWSHDISTESKIDCEHFAAVIMLIISCQSSGQFWCVTTVEGVRIVPVQKGRALESTNELFERTKVKIKTTEIS